MHFFIAGQKTRYNDKTQHFHRTTLRIVFFLIPWFIVALIFKTIISLRSTHPSDPLPCRPTFSVCTAEYSCQHVFKPLKSTLASYRFCRQLQSTPNYYLSSPRLWGKSTHSFAGPKITKMLYCTLNIWYILVKS